MVILETGIFSRIIQEMLTDDEYQKLQEALVGNPAIGDLIKNSGGLRKLRWSIAGRGKRGGIRVIYYWYRSNDQIYMLYAYSKIKQENLTTEQLKLLKKVVDEELSNG